MLCEEISLASAEGDCWFLAAAADGEPRLRLVVAQRYAPAGYGFNPGIAFVPGTGVLFAGAGTRLLAYALPGRTRTGHFAYPRRRMRAAPAATVVASVHPAAIRMYDSHCSAPPGLNAYFWPRFTTGSIRSIV